MTGTLSGNAAARSLIEQLPLTLSFRDYGGQEKIVKLRAPLPVYLGYWTARISADGILQFRDDLYGIDAHQAALLAATVNRLKTHADLAATRAQAAAAPVQARKR